MNADRYGTCASTGDVWDFYVSVGSDSRDGLSRAERDVAAICDFRQEVNSGGFDSYFRYWGGNTAAEALAVLDSVLDSKWSELLREAMSLFGSSYPIDVDAREQILDRDYLGPPLHQLDMRFYDLEASMDADAVLSVYLATA